MQNPQTTERPQMPLSEFLKAFEKDITENENSFPLNEPHSPDWEPPSPNGEGAVDDSFIGLTSSELPKKRERDDIDCDRAEKKAKVFTGAKEDQSEWLGEVHTTDLGSQQPWYYKGKKLAKKKFVFGQVVHRRQLIKQNVRMKNCFASNKIWNLGKQLHSKSISNESLGTCNSHDSGFVGHFSCPSPYYPHPLLNQPEDLYKETSTSCQQNKNKATNVKVSNINVPHELYEKHRYHSYIDLDRPTEFYNFDFDAEGNFIATTNLPTTDSVNNTGGDFSTNDRFVFGESQNDSFVELLDTLKIIRQENEEHVGGIPLFSCHAISPGNKGEGSPNVMLTTPTHEALYPHENVFPNWTLNPTNDGFDREFEELWNNEC